jgi:hypothetical protein
MFIIKSKINDCKEADPLITVKGDLKMTQKNVITKWNIILVIMLTTAAGIFISGCAALDAFVYENQGAAYQPPVEYNIDELNQYGQWVDVPEYGRVWDPSVVSDWEPFHNGHWVYSDNNWTWISYEPFGWIVYHYGYWLDDSIYGWVWIPANTGWSPATVQWRRFDDYVSWAPLPPRGVVYSEPWEEKKTRHWHTVNSDSFMKDNVGRLRVAQPKVRDNNGDRKTAATPVTQDKKDQTVRTRENVGDKVKDATSPVPRDLEQKTGQKVNNTPIVKEQPKNQGSNLRRMNLPDSERKRVDSNSKDVQQKVLVPKTNQSTPKKAEKKNENDNKKDEKSDERRR